MSSFEETFEITDMERAHLCEGQLIQALKSYRSRKNAPLAIARKVMEAQPQYRNPDYKVNDYERQLTSEGRWIEAIKNYKSRTGQGLAVSKFVIDIVRTSLLPGSVQTNYNEIVDKAVRDVANHYSINEKEAIKSLIISLTKKL